jgi:hypothetical protein
MHKFVSREAKTICRQQQATRTSRCKSGQMMVAILRKAARHRFLGGVFLERLVFGDVFREACLGGLFEPASTMHILCRVYLPQRLVVRNDRRLPSSLDVSFLPILYSFNALSTQHRWLQAVRATLLQLICNSSVNSSAGAGQQSVFIDPPFSCCRQPLRVSRQPLVFNRIMRTE